MNALLLVLLLIFGLLGFTAGADRRADSNNIFMSPTVKTDTGLMTPDSDQSLWGMGSIPSVSRLKTVLGNRRAKNFCGKEFARLEEMQKRINATQIPVGIQALRDAVKPYGISPKMLDKTVAVFLRNQTLIPNQRFITIFDHTQPSTAKRFVIIDLWKGKAKGYRSAHGSGSDPKRTLRAQSFGNEVNTNKSSVGCALANHRYRAKTTPQEPRGRWAISILGFEPTNDASCDRGVYMHAAPYVSYQKGVSESARGYDSNPGRSWGCPAFNYADRDDIFDRIDGGGLICSWGS